MTAELDSTAELCRKPAPLLEFLEFSAAAVIFVSLLIGFSAVAVMQGLMCGAFAVYGNQLVKQMKKANGNDQQ
ncbi:phage holin family protein [Paenibacillus elgii]|uniref:phage holin family protein n=1 Tax=Paenibacillus elgii TaxID=189691 RepID=UPI000248D975|nr:phage holin family protein [Paenibacillus elgii]